MWPYLCENTSLEIFKELCSRRSCSPVLNNIKSRGHPDWCVCLTFAKIWITPCYTEFKLSTNSQSSPVGQCSSPSNDDLSCIHFSNIISQRVTALPLEFELLSGWSRLLLPGCRDELVTVISLGTAESSVSPNLLDKNYLHS